MVDSFQSFPPWCWSSDYCPNEHFNKWSCYKRYLKYSLFPILVSMNKLVILWKISATFVPSTADKPSMCFGSSFSRISALRNCGVCDAMRAHLYLGNEPAHLAPIQVHSQVFNIIKQTAETVGHTEKYLLNYRILSEGMCSCSLLVGLSRNRRYIGSEIPGSFSAAECTLSVYLKPQITCSLALSLSVLFHFSINTKLWKRYITFISIHA